MSRILDSSASARLRDALGPLAIVLVAFTTGLTSGLINVLIRYARPGPMFEAINFPTYYMWMAPAADCVVMLVLGVVLAAASLVFKGLSAPVVVLTVLMFPAGTMLAMTLLPFVHSWAVAAFSFGLSYQGARLLSGLRGRLDRPRRAVVLYCLAGLMAISAFAVGRYQTAANAIARQAEAQPKAAANAPNVLLVTLDVLRSANMSLHGYERPTTPNLDRWATKGTVFDRAYSTTSWTLPGHATMLTGLGAHETGTSWLEPLADEKRTLAEVLRDEGYSTAGFVANWEYCNWRTGLSQGFLHYEDYVIRPETILNCTLLGQFLYKQAAARLHRSRGLYAGRKNAETLTDDFLSWLGRRDRGRPFFAFVNYIDIHKPYDPPPRFRRMFSHQRPSAPPRRVARLSAGKGTHQLRLLDRYDACVAYVDSQVDRLLKHLESKRLLENTIVVITSDHGHTFDEHVSAGHGNSLYVETIHVPLMVIDQRRVPSGKRVTQPVSLIDLGRTILDLAGSTGAAVFPGRSLVGLIDDSQPVEPSPLVFHLVKGMRPPPRSRNLHGEVHALIIDDWHYVRNGDSSLGEELYDLSKDPFEQDDRAADPAVAERLASLRKALSEARK